MGPTLASLPIFAPPPSFGFPSRMPTAAQRAQKIREIYLSFPDTVETPTWGKPHFRVADKIFGGLDEEEGRLSIGFKLGMEHAAERVANDPRFSKAPYVGHKGWVNMDVSATRDWEEIRALVGESYRLIAPKRSLAKLAGAATETSLPAKERAAKATAKPGEKKVKRAK